MHILALTGLPGHTEIILIVFIAVLLFGAKKLPELSRALGKSLGEFKKGQKEGAESDKKSESDKNKTAEKVDTED